MCGCEKVKLVTVVNIERTKYSIQQKDFYKPFTHSWSNSFIFLHHTNTNLSTKYVILRGAIHFFHMCFWNVEVYGVIGGVVTEHQFPIQRHMFLLQKSKATAVAMRRAKSTLLLEKVNFQFVFCINIDLLP